MASLLTTNLVFAGDAYKNNVVDVKVNKESSNAVKVTIYTDRPYTEPVVVNKKANNKYVILMPETKSSLKSAPSVSNVSGTVSNVSVNTQAVSGGKGYTKIIITSEKAITVVPHTQQLSSAAKHTQTATQTAQQKARQEAKAKQIATQKAAQQKAQQEAKAKQIAAQKAAQKKAQQEAKAKQIAAQKAAQKKAQQEAKAKQIAAQKAAQQKAQQEAKAKQIAAQKAAQQKAQQEAKAKQIAAQKTSKPITKKQTQPIDILEQEIKTDKNAQYTQNSNDEILNKEIKENIQNNQNEKVKKKKPAIQEMNDDKLSIIENIKAVIKDYQNINLWKLLLLASAITFPVIVIMIILGLDKRINKRIQKSFKKEDEYNYNPAPTYNNVEDIPQSQQNQNPSFNSFEEMLNQVDEPTPTFHEEQLHKAQYEKFEQSVQEMQSIPNQIAQNDVQQESMNEDVEPVEPVEPEIISDEQFTNDFENDDFEHDFEEDVKEPTEEITPIVKDEEKEEPQETVEVQNEPVQPSVQPSIQPPVTPMPPVAPAVTEPVQQVPATQYTPDGYLSDFAGVNDKDFFDELVIQSMAENNANGLPEETPADEIFDIIAEDSKQKNNLEKIEVKPEIKTPVQQEITQIEQVASSTANSVQQVNNVIQNTNINNDTTTEPIQTTDNSEQTSEQQNDDDLTMLTEAKINDNTGLYLVNYENFSSLVGHINDDYFVIKKFDEIVNGNIILKQTEKLKDSTRYLVRIGKNKMVIEVTPTSMNRLLDL